ncbi:hypothetical protein B0H21DRAFT_827558 [Amylocystis lapponica]|nr:hypothetical protein B0H21DRAFT_827558 [Amylocystis lapponica]
MPAGSRVTLHHLITDKKYNGPLYIEGDRYIVYFTVSNEPLHRVVNNRLHSCLAPSFWARFPADSNAISSSHTEPYAGCKSGPAGCELGPPGCKLGLCNVSESGQLGDAEEVGESSGGEAVAAIAGLHIHEQMPVVPSPRPLSLVSRDVSFTSSSSILPPSIWQQPWTPTGDSVPWYNIENLATEVYKSAAGPDTQLRLSGRTVVDLTDKLEVFINEAITTGDFTSVLSPNRTVLIVNENNEIVSSGEGIEREMIFTIFSKFIANSTQWFHPRADDRATLRVLHSAKSACSVPLARIRNLKKLGAVCALMLIIGQTPDPLGPAIFQFLVHGCDLHALHPTFIGEWHPNLCKTLLDWNAMDHTGDVSRFEHHFATFHDYEASSVTGRDQAEHAAYAAKMLYRALIGPASYRHPEWQAFLYGLRLPCCNGFDFLQVPKSFAGGSEVFFSMIWTSYISDFASLESYLHFDSHTSLMQEDLQLELRQDLGDSDFTLASLVIDFLKQTGIPLPDAFASVRETFNSIIDLSQIDSPSFCPRMFTWAVSGVPFLDTNFQSIEVKFVDNDNPQYCENANLRDIMIGEGKLSFHTCYRTVLIPLSYIADISEKSISEDNGQFHCAVSHWLLCEILGVIGSHTIL